MVHKHIFTEPTPLPFCITCGVVRPMRDLSEILSANEIIAIERARLARLVRAIPMSFGQHTCWDNHEGDPHLDGSECHDRIIGESILRDEVLKLLEINNETIGI